MLFFYQKKKRKIIFLQGSWSHRSKDCLPLVNQGM